MSEWTDDKVALLRIKAADPTKSYALISRELGISKNAVTGKLSRLNLNNRGSPLKPDVPKTEKRPRRRPSETLGKLPALLVEPTPTENLPASQLAANLMKFLDTRGNVPTAIRKPVQEHIGLIAVRATNIHPDLQTMPRNVTEAVRDAMTTTLAALKQYRPTEGEGFKPHLPLVLSHGAALVRKALPGVLTLRSFASVQGIDHS